jgi:hypothetical protein
MATQIVRPLLGIRPEKSPSRNVSFLLLWRMIAGDNGLDHNESGLRLKQRSGQSRAVHLENLQQLI